MVEAFSTAFPCELPPRATEFALQQSPPYSSPYVQCPRAQRVSTLLFRLALFQPADRRALTSSRELHFILRCCTRISRTFPCSISSQKGTVRDSPLSCTVRRASAKRGRGRHCSETYCRSQQHDAYPCAGAARAAISIASLCSTADEHCQIRSRAVVLLQARVVFMRIQAAG